MRTPPARLPHGVRLVVDWTLTIVFAIAIVLAVKTFVVNPYRIPSSSMEPTLHCARPGFRCESGSSDRVLANLRVFPPDSPWNEDVSRLPVLENSRRMVAAVYSNRLKRGMPLQADPTVIYPVTKGKPLGRRILRSELEANNGYNTYAMTGLPKGPIANPGRASIAAVLDPAPTNALYFVADGTGGHVFADTLQQHQANVARWYAIRRARGEM